MTSYLIASKSGPMPFTGAEICTELGIDPAEFAFTLDGLIASEVIMSANPVRHTVWWTSVSARFEQETKHGNCGPTTVGEPFEYQGRMFRECTYEPRDWAVAILRKAVIEKARTSEDVHLWRAISEADERKRSAARVELRDQLTGSLELAEAV
jgi:hypothetical protein